MNSTSLSLVHKTQFLNEFPTYLVGSENPKKHDRHFTIDCLISKSIANMFGSSKKDVAKSIKTLLVMLRSMRDQQVTITLRNDTIATGTIVSVDSNMNIELKNALVGPDPFYITKEEEEEVVVVVVVEDKQKDKNGLSNNKGDPDQACGQTKKRHDNKPPAREALLTLSEDSQEGYHDDEDRKSSSDDDDDLQAGEQTLDLYIVKGTRIRHIDVPDDIDLFASTKEEIERIRGRGKQWTKRDIVRP